MFSEIGSRIKTRRQQLNMSAEDLADLVGISHATMYRYENGDIAKVSIIKLMPIAQALHTTPGWLMGWEESPMLSDEGELLSLYASLNDEGKRALLAVAGSFASNPEYKKAAQKFG